jgi:hypothetical protein
MKKKDIFLLTILLGLVVLLLTFSSDMRNGAYNGLILAENTIIPSLLPLLIIFLLIVKTGARDVLAKLFGFISVRIFNLPKATFPAIFLGLIGGYPTGALLTYELYKSDEIDTNQAKSMLCFNFCGGCGFIITAVGSGILQSTKAGLILFFSNVISNIFIGFALSFKSKRIDNSFYSFRDCLPFSTALTSAVDSAIKSVLNITAFIILFSAIDNIFKIPKLIMPLIEITNGVCSANTFSLPQMSAYLAFGGLCIHMQVLPTILQCKAKYIDFLLSRIISAVLSYCITKLLLTIFPVEISVFSNTSQRVAVFSSVNLGLSFLLILGCFVLVLDINSRKRAIDN